MKWLPVVAIRMQTRDASITSCIELKSRLVSADGKAGQVHYYSYSGYLLN